LNNVLLNLTWNGEKLHYTYKKPFDLIVEFNESPSWGGWLLEVKDIIKESYVTVSN